MVRLQVLLLLQHLSQRQSSLQKLRHLLYLPLKHFSPSIYRGSTVLLLLQERCSACCLYQGRGSSCHYKWNNNLDLSDASTAVIALLQLVAVPASYCLCSIISSAVKAPVSVTVSAVATNVGAATALASVTMSFVIVNQKSSCYLCSCNSSSLRSIDNAARSTAST